MHKPDEAQNAPPPRRRPPQCALGEPGASCGCPADDAEARSVGWRRLQTPRATHRIQAAGLVGWLASGKNEYIKNGNLKK